MGANRRKVARARLRSMCSLIKAPAAPAAHTTTWVAVLSKPEAVSLVPVATTLMDTCFSLSRLYLKLGTVTTAVEQSTIQSRVTERSVAVQPRVLVVLVDSLAKSSLMERLKLMPNAGMTTAALPLKTPEFAVAVTPGTAFLVLSLAFSAGVVRESCVFCSAQLRVMPLRL